MTFYDLSLFASHSICLQTSCQFYQKLVRVARKKWWAAVKLSMLWNGYVALLSFGHWGVLKAVSNVNDILAPKLVGLDVTDQAKIDKLMVEETLGLHEKFTIVHSSYCNSWPPSEAHLGAFKSHQQFRWFEWFLWAPVWGDLATGCYFMLFHWSSYYFSRQPRMDFQLWFHFSNVLLWHVEKIAKTYQEISRVYRA